MNVLALDLSLTSTGYAYDRPHIGLEAATINPTMVGPERLDLITCHVLTMAETADLVAIEGYAHGRHNRAHQIGELGGVIRLTLWRHRIPYLEVAPTKIKKYATGSGRAGKDEVLVEAVRRLGYAGSSRDEADALWLHALVHDLAGDPVVDVPQKHRTALDGLDVPALTDG